MTQGSVQKLLKRQKNVKIKEDDGKTKISVLEVMENDNSTLMEDNNHFLEELVKTSKYVDSSDSEGELETHLRSLKEDYLTLKIPPGHPLQPNLKEKKSGTYKRVRDNLRKTYLNKVETMERDLVTENIK